MATPDGLHIEFSPPRRPRTMADAVADIDFIIELGRRIARVEAEQIWSWRIGEPCLYSGGRPVSLQEAEAMIAVACWLATQRDPWQSDAMHNLMKCLMGMFPDREVEGTAEGIEVDFGEEMPRLTCSQAAKIAGFDDEDIVITFRDDSRHSESCTILSYKLVIFSPEAQSER